MLPLDDFELMGQYFWQQMQIYNVGYINFANEQGEFIGVERTQDNQFLINETRAPALDQMSIFETDDQGDLTQPVTVSAPKPATKEEWYVAAATAGTPIWSEIYQWDDQPDVLSISASYPLYDEQQLIGVIGTDLVVSQISQFLRELTQNQSGTIFVVERSGALVASSSAYHSFQVKAGEAQRLMAFDSPDPVIQATAQQLQAEISTKATILQDTSMVFELEGIRHYTNVNVYQDELGLDWLIITVVPETEFIGQINQNTRITILICLLAAAIAILSCLITSRWINQPIKELVAASQAIARGELNQSLKPQFIREFEGLNQAFNAMTGQLRSAFTEVEDRVAQRTAELATAKKQADIANQSKTRFLTNVSHELRAPLNVILGFTQVMLDDAQLPLKYQDAICRIRQNGQSLLTLMNAILRVTRLEEDVSTYDVCFNLHAFLENEHTKLHSMTTVKKLELILKPISDLPQFIYTDELKLHEVLKYLVSNMVDRLQQGQIVIGVLGTPIHTDTNRKYQLWNLQFEIESSGVDIPPLKVTDNNQMVTQISPNDTLSQGSELGLYISREYIRLMGGKLTCKTTASHTVAFQFILPVRVMPSFNKTSKSTNVLSPDSSSSHINTSANNRETIHTMSRIMLTMPNDWLNQLEQAALKGSDSILEELIEEIPEEYSDLIDFLRAKILSFQFDFILDLVNTVRHETVL